MLDRVSKQYGNKIAVNRISTVFRPGVIGLLGANGAGKTTLMRMICGILRPTGGTICFKDGGTLDASEELYRNALGYLPQEFGYYSDFTGKDFLMYLAALKGLYLGVSVPMWGQTTPEVDQSCIIRLSSR